MPKLDPKMMQIFGITFGLGMELSLVVVAMIFLSEYLQNKFGGLVTFIALVILLGASLYHFYLRIKNFRANYRK